MVFGLPDGTVQTTGLTTGHTNRKGRVMSVVTEAVGRRMTLGDICSRYGFELVPQFAGSVTITSISSDIDSIMP